MVLGKYVPEPTGLLASELFPEEVCAVFFDGCPKFPLAEGCSPGETLGRGTVQSSFNITGGRPVIELAKHSIPCKLHHVRWSVSFLAVSVLLSSFLRCKPKAKASLVEMPTMSQALLTCPMIRK